MSRRIALAWVLGLALLAVATAPLALLVEHLKLAPQGLTAVEASGSVWHGVLRSARWRGQSLGDVSIRLQALPLLLGERRLRVDNASWQGTLLDGSRQGLVGGNGIVTLPAMAALSGSSLSISMQDAVLVFKDQQCVEASGSLHTTLQTAIPSVPELRLSGVLSCARQQGRVVLASAADAPLRVDGILTLGADASYTLQSTAQVQDPAVKLMLQLAGFRETPSGLVRSDNGHLAN